MSDVDVTTSELTETPDLYGAFPRLNDRHIQILESLGVRRTVGAEQVLVREGERNANFIVVLDGFVEVVSDYGGENRPVAIHGPGRFLGELGLIRGESSFVTNVMRTSGEVLEVPVQHLRQLVDRDPALGELILRAFIVRRSMLIKLGAGLRIVGSRFTSETRRICEFAIRNRLPFTFVDLEGDESAHQLLETFGVTPDETPVVVWTDGRVLRNPTNADLARLIGLPHIESPQLVVDLVIVGAGPAGLAAAVYGASEGLSTIVLDAIATGGQAATSSRIENYLGFPAGISGAELAERAIVQAEKFGADLSVPSKVISLEESRGYHVVRTDGGTELLARAAVIATGVHYRRLDVPGLMELEASCVFYAATFVEAEMCRNDPVVVVGGGNSAGQAAMLLADHAVQVTLVVREGSLRENMSAYLADRIERNPKIDVLLNSEIRECIGDGPLEAVVVENTASRERRTVPAREIFVFIGAEPHTRWLDGQLALDDRGYICTGPAAANAASANGHKPEEPLLFLETSRPGIFAAGDVRSGSVKRIASAVGEGAMAVRLVHDRLTTAAT
ncbi:MAG: thioredoxin reductase [Frankiales bacterium]|jgi:thioredoxin reductase (NADPH)|nr:thioredoxin reductase [Frankiales bacterium]